jgi:K+-transporting ATPase ATPase C chain
MREYTLKQIKTAIMLFLVFTIMTGVIYPVLVTGIAQLFFSRQANGSLIQLDNKIIGSRFIGQNFTDPAYFWGRPSKTEPEPYNTLNSSGSNLSVSSPVLLENVKERIKQLKEADSSNQKLIPVDLVTASASGLDPHISLLSALYQVERVAKLRGMTAEQVNKIIQTISHNSFCNVLGEPRVNVLKLNMKLDEISKKTEG